MPEIVDPEQAVRFVMGIPEVLYHFTDAAGLAGILSSQRLFATDALYLGDGEESTFPLEALSYSLDRLTEEATSLGITTEVLELLAVATSLGDLLTRRRLHLYVASFAASTEIGALWSARGDGPRFALGFALDELRRAAVEAWPVMYGGGHHFELIHRRITEHALALSSAEASDASALYELLEEIFEAAPFVKRPELSHEQEWRIGTRLADERARREALRFRASPLGLTPYIELPLSSTGRLPLQELCYAKGRHDELARRVLEEQLAIAGFEARSVAIRGVEVLATS